jgi:DnaK suppressor protein
MSGKKAERRALLQGLLQEQKRRLWNELRQQLFGNNAEQLHSQFDYAMDVAEQGSLDMLADTELKVADIHREELTRMDEAERKFHAGSYGVCEECGMEISEARLAVAPFAPCCVSCQALREKPIPPPQAKY